MPAHWEGHDVLLVFVKDVGPAIKQACQVNCHDAGHQLACAATIGRPEMLTPTNVKFNGTFEGGFQQESLLALVGMILGGQKH